MIATDTFTVDSVSHTAYKALFISREIVFREQGGNATKSYTYRAPNSSSPAVTKVAGESSVFKRGVNEANFNVNDTIALFDASAGSLTFDVTYQ